MPSLVGVCRLLLESKGEKFEVLFDEEDREVVESRRWYVQRVSGLTYAASNTAVSEGSRTIVRMHRVLLGAPAGKAVDHINGNGLDNRRRNLRACTCAENAWNSRVPKTNTSGYKGVYRGRSSWVARISYEGRLSRYLGSFRTTEAAARAYDRAAIRLHGEFARLNFPRSDYE